MRLKTEDKWIFGGGLVLLVVLLLRLPWDALLVTVQDDHGQVDSAALVDYHTERRRPLHRLWNGYLIAPVPSEGEHFVEVRCKSGETVIAAGYVVPFLGASVHDPC